MDEDNLTSARRSVHYDEAGIAEHDKTRGTRMKIAEPKTPFHRPALEGSPPRGAPATATAPGAFAMDPRLSEALAGGWADAPRGGRGAIAAAAASSAAAPDLWASMERTVAAASGVGATAASAAAAEAAEPFVTTDPHDAESGASEASGFASKSRAFYKNEFANVRALLSQREMSDDEDEEGEEERGLGARADSASGGGTEGAHADEDMG